jgi:glucose-fructose oxidoreductase
MATNSSPAEPPREVRYAVIGLGYISQVAVLPAFEHAHENSRLCALVSNDPDKRRELSRRYDVPRTCDYDGYDDLLHSGEIDAVYIALPNHLHRNFAVRAAQAGIHVLCEKPMAVTVADCEAMIHAAAQHRVKLMVAYRLHFEAANLQTVELIRTGQLGPARAFHSLFTLSIEKGNIRLSRHELGGGTLYDIGIYCINAARYMFEAEPLQVFALRAHSDEPRFANAEEMTSAVLRFPNERIASFTCSFAAADVSNYQVVGTRGSVRLDPAYEYAGALKQTIMIDGETRERVFGRRDQFAPELVYFSNCIRFDEQPEPSGWEGLADVRVICAAYESARLGRPVELPPFERKRRPTLAQEINKPPVEEPTLVHAIPPSRH